MTSPPSPAAASGHAVGLAEWLARRAARAPHRPAITFEGETWSYGDLVERIARMSAVLAAGGVYRGARVGYLGFNHPSFFVALFAAARLGAITAAINFRLSGPEFAYVINDSGVHTLIVGEEHVAVVDSVRDRLACARYIHRGAEAPGYESAETLMAAPPPAPPAVPVGADDVAVIMYTSGATGHPKGAMLTHGNFWTNNLNEIMLWDMVSSDVKLTFASLFHVGGLLCGTMSMRRDKA